MTAPYIKPVMMPATTKNIHSIINQAMTIVSIAEIYDDNSSNL